MWLDFKVRMEFEASWYSVQDIPFHCLELKDVIQHFASYGLFLWTQSLICSLSIAIFQNIAPIVTTLWGGGGGRRFIMSYTLSFESWGFFWFKRFVNWSARTGELVFGGSWCFSDTRGGDWRQLNWLGKSRWQSWISWNVSSC